MKLVLVFLSVFISFQCFAEIQIITEYPVKSFNGINCASDIGPYIGATTVDYSTVFKFSSVELCLAIETKSKRSGFKVVSMKGPGSRIVSELTVGYFAIDGAFYQQETISDI